MNFILYLLNSILWGLWRRCLGWEHSPIRRSVLVALMFVMLLPLAFKSWLLYAIVSALSAIMWTMGHQYENKHGLKPPKNGMIEMSLSWVKQRRLTALKQRLQK